jgi:hypothetical protein
MSLAANKDVVRRFYAEVINGPDLAPIDHLLTEDFVHNGEARGRAGQQQAVQAFFDAFDAVASAGLMAQLTAS